MKKLFVTFALSFSFLIPSSFFAEAADPDYVRPYSVECLSPNAVIVGSFSDFSCFATINIDGAFVHLQSLSKGKWTTIQTTIGVNNRASFDNVYFSEIEIATMRVVTDPEAGKYLGYTTPNFKIEVSAQKNSLSSGGSSLASTKAPSGKVDKKSNAYKTMHVVGKNFAKVSMANDTAADQCGSAMRTGLIRIRGIPQYLGAQTRMIQSYLKTASGWRGCLDGFGK